MQLAGYSLPGYRVYEYMIVINPHHQLANKIREVKQEFYDKYEVASMIGNPQLTLANFIQYEMMEDRIINRLRAVAMGYHPFKVELKDFGSFPSHTIYINVTSKLPVQGLVKQIRSETQRLMKLNDDNKPHFIMEPHFTIARKLKPWQYEKGWLEYSNKKFSGRFIADGMTLLKRAVVHEGAIRAKYQVVARFEFENLPVSTRQGELFG